MDEEFEVVTGEQLREKHGHWQKSGKALDPALVPENLRHLIPFAETYGISDDITREKLLENTNEEDLQALSRLVSIANLDLNSWLSGPESKVEMPSKEYVAFSALRMFVLSI